MKVVVLNQYLLVGETCGIGRSKTLDTIAD
jgi:hypothetical protein